MSKDRPVVQLEHTKEKVFPNAGRFLSHIPRERPPVECGLTDRRTNEKRCTNCAHIPVAFRRYDNERRWWWRSGSRVRHAKNTNPLLAVYVRSLYGFMYGVPRVCRRRKSNDNYEPSRGRERSPPQSRPSANLRKSPEKRPNCGKCEYTPGASHTHAAFTCTILQVERKRA